jgi:3-hydroxyisobutyrate dehydrogenase-like beta-hydroxyacid dehydrogenase
MTMLSNDAAVEAVTLGDEGLNAGLAKDAIHISMSSISPNLSKQVAIESNAVDRYLKP